MESRMRGSRKSGSEGGGEETTGRKAGIGASPPTLRGTGADCATADAASSSVATAPPSSRRAAAFASEQKRGRRAHRTVRIGAG
jgi:hypothetical protein